MSLAEEIKKQGLEFVAKELEIKESTLKRKMNTGDFTLGQIKKIKLIFELDNEQLCEMLNI